MLILNLNKNFKNLASTNLWKKMDLQPGAQQLDVQQYSSFKKDLTTTDVQHVKSTTVSSADVFTIKGWPVPNTRSATLSAKVMKISSSLLEEPSLSNAPSAIIGFKEYKDAPLWLVSAGNSFAMSVEAPPALMECAATLQKEIFHLLALLVGQWLDQCPSYCLFVDPNQTLWKRKDDRNRFYENAINIVKSHFEPKERLKLGSTLGVREKVAVFIGVRGSIHIVEGFQYIINCLLLFINTFIDSLLQLLVLAIYVLLHFSYCWIEPLVVRILSFLTLSHIEDHTWIQTNLLDFLLKRGDCSFYWG